MLGEVLLAQGDLPSARRQYEEALETRKKIGAQDLVAESQVSLAGLALEEGHPEQAESLLRQAIVEFEKENATPDSAGAYVGLSRALQMQNKVDDAATTVAHADELSRGNPDPALKLPLAIQEARVRAARAASGAAGQRERAAARRQLESVISNARRLGYYETECEARLALVELDRSEGTPSAGPLAAALENETRRNGFLLLSRKAALLGSSSRTAN